MCSPPCIDQSTSQPPFDFTVNTSPKPKNGLSKRKVLALYEDYLKERVKENWPSVQIGNRLFKEIKAKGYRGSFDTMKKFLCRVRKESELPKEKSLSYYKGYIKKSLQKNQPNCVSARTLFNEITAKGYRGSFSAVQKSLWVIRKEIKAPQEASIQFHKEYLIKRVEEAYPKYVSGTELFKEIKAKGYQGTLKKVRSFLVPVHKNVMPRPSLSLYKNYLIKRVKDALPDPVSGRQLFEEIREQGYQGSLSTLQTFLSGLRKKEKRPSEVSLSFHKSYLLKRVKDASPGFVSTSQLFEEIKAKGYRGSASTLQVFLSTVYKQEKRLIEQLSNASLKFHKDYLIKRLEETYPSYLSGTQLFKEIRTKGYRGSVNTLQRFLSMLRKQAKKPSEACVEFHEEYLIKRLEETYPSYISGTQLFKEIRAKGYQESLSTLQRFLLILRKQAKKPSEACVEFHEEYLIKRLEEAYPSYISGPQLFKEIRAKGYRGSLSTLQRFLLMLRRQAENPSEACVEFHEEYLSKRIKDAVPNFVPAQKLFEEITDRGYRGGFSTLKVFLSTLNKQEKIPSKESLEVHRNYSISELDENDLPKPLDRAPLVHRNVLPETSLQFHKDYLIKKLQETWPNCLPPEQLFEEIISRGYQGTCKEIEVFLMMISK